jgi:hypothetical protein
VKRKIDLKMSDPSLPHAFPQCGAGRKHERRDSVAVLDTFVGPKS